MAKKTPFQKKKIQDTENSGFGNYDEGVGGGGSPNGASKPSDHGHGVNSDYRKENNDTMQPRTNDGKFTYKSVNGQSIDPKYGPSRGKTVNPLLTGGENGVMIEDVEQQFYAQKGGYWDKYKDSWYQKGSEIVTAGDFKVRVAAETIWNVAKGIYNEVTGEFGGDIEFEHQLGNGGTKKGEGQGGAKEGETFSETKKGRHGAEESAAKQRAQASGAEQGVINQSTGGLKLKPGTVVQPPVVQPKPQPGAKTGNTPVIPTGGTTGTQPGVSPSVNVATASDIVNADYTPKYSDDDISQARDILKEQGFTDDELADFDSLSPKEKDDYIDKYFGEEEEEEVSTEATTTQDTSSNPPSSEEQPEEEDSEAVKKIKKMGFSD